MALRKGDTELESEAVEEGEVRTTKQKTESEIH